MRGAMLAVMAVAALVAAAWTGSAAAMGTADEQPAAASSGAVRPVDGPVVRHFEAPAHPYGPGHRGVDLAAEAGTTVRVALPGVVTFGGEVARRGWVTVDHGGGLDTTYGVIDPRFVTAGQQVRAGQPLGEVAAGAEHLDWGARLHGTYIDPLRLLSRWRPHLVRLPR
ncbi:MAG TPA: M23 family metallopeptidase [Egibacteraceae bacterium]|nr:M23 family metallopeptidase [Egibacteraceae bacterium]